MEFPFDVHRPWTMRDAFIKASRNPIQAFSRGERLMVLDSVSFAARRGERIGILGVNGTGKTTLCRCIAGLYRPAFGDIRVQGKVRAVFDAGVGIFPELTGRENARLLAELMYPEEPQNHADIVEDALGFSELGRFVDVPYRTYSHGMQARLCLSIISSRPSDLLILDEVFDGADSFFREKISARVLNIIRQSGVVLFVSHSAEQIRAVCNRVIVLEQGKVSFDGAVGDGLKHYLSRHKSS